MSTVISTITVDFDNHDEAIALKELLEEMGLHVNFSRRISNPDKGTCQASSQRLGMLMLEEMEKTPNSTFTSEDLAEICEMLRYNPRSWAPVISKLVEEGKVERLVRGIYRLPRRVEMNQNVA